LYFKSIILQNAFPHLAFADYIFHQSQKIATDSNNIRGPIAILALEMLSTSQEENKSLPLS